MRFGSPLLQTTPGRPGVGPVFGTLFCFCGAIERRAYALEQVIGHGILVGGQEELRQAQLAVPKVSSREKIFL